jgi:HD-GYP domain-containing protein (c-di-GMP phosphodiesterase class II)
MTTDRPYRKAITKDQALRNIVENAGRQFDPEIVEVFLYIARQELLDVQQKKVILILEREGHIAYQLR